jgi:hypothetical protein
MYLGVQFIDGKTVSDVVIEKKKQQIRPILQEAGLIK